jgi:hypothetical protein
VATAADIAALRLLIAELDGTTYTDEVLAARLTTDVDKNLTAYNIWTEKAAAAATLVDISEGGSSRKMSDVQAQALKMAAYFEGRLPDSESPIADRTIRIRKLTRP